VRLLQLEDLPPYQLHLLHLTVHYARKQVSMISTIICSRLAEHQRRQRARSARRASNTCARMRFSTPPAGHTNTVRGILTFMFVLVRSASLGLELGAHLLKELRETSARHWPRRAHATMRVIHLRCESVAKVRDRFQVDGFSGIVGGLQSRLRCDGLQPCRGGCRTANALRLVWRTRESAWA
jgi:hypothetical protein